MLPLGSISLTVASFDPLVSVLPSVTGKSEDVVVPVTATLPEAFTAMSPADWLMLRPKNVT